MSKSGGTSVNHQNWRRTKEEFSTLIPQQEGYKSANTIRLPRRSGPRVIQHIPPSAGSTPLNILAQQGGREPKILTRTHSKIKPGYNRASYGPRYTPIQLPMDPAAPRHGVLLITLLQSWLDIPLLPSVGCLLDVGSPPEQKSTRKQDPKHQELKAPQKSQ